MRYNITVADLFSSDMNKKLIIAGGGLLALGAVVLLYPIFVIANSKYMTTSLREQAHSIVPTDFAYTMPSGSKIADSYKSGLYPEPASAILLKPGKGEIIGRLSIPSLQIDEAIIEGTDQPELAKAPGHLPDSVLPGQVGKSIVAAHNATIFRYLDQLKPGTTFIVTTKQGVFTFQVTDQRILQIKDALPDTAYPALALETCYPLDALYLTDQRLFVEAALVTSDLK